MKNSKLFFSICVMILTFIFSTDVEAAGLSIRASKTSAYIGETIVITVSTNDPIGSCRLTSSNNAVASFSGDTSCGFQSPSGQITYSLKTKAIGSTTITLTPTNMASVSSEAKYTTSSSVTINVKAKPVVVLSGDNALGSLGVDGKELSPTFNRDTLEYSVELEPETTSINIWANASHGGASIAGAGAREVVDGDNRLEVIVTAENGSKRTYVINASVKEYNPIKQNIGDKEYTVVRKKSQLKAPENYTETTVTIEDEEVPAFTSEVTKYILVGLKNESGNIDLYVYKDGKYTLYKEYTFNKVVLYPLEMDESKVPHGYNKTTIIYNDEKIEAYKMSELSNYAILYGMNIETGETHLYMYDEEEDTLQIYNDEMIKPMSEKLEQLKLMVAVLSGISAFLFLLCIIIGSSKGKSKSKKDGLDSIDDIEVTKLAGSTLSKREEKRIQKQEQLRKQEEDKRFRKEEKIRLKEDSKRLKEELKQEKKNNKRKKKEKDIDIDIRDIKGTE